MPSSSSEEEEEEETEKEEEDRRKKRAELEKERGNQLFKEGKYQAAVERYTRAIDLDPTSHILPANRAMALIKLKRYAAAESDCNVSIALEEDYLKAWQRRAAVRTKLGKIEEALDDYKQVLKIDPLIKTASLEIKKLEDQIAKQKTISRSVTNEELRDPKYVFPIKRPPHLRSNKSLVRINIDEVGGVNIDEVGGVSEHSEEEKTNEVQNIPLEVPTEDLQSPLPKEQSHRTEGEENSRMGVAIEVPTSSIQFMSQWKSLRSNEQLLTIYFKAIPPSKYPSLLNQSLETSVFSDILTILQHSYTSPEPCMDVLQWLTKVPRFGVAIMFLSKKDKEKLTAVFQTLFSHTEQQELVTQLAKQYSLNLK